MLNKRLVTARRGAGAITRGLVRGLTLVELMVTLVVLGIIAFASLPDISTVITNARIRSTTESVVSGLQRARVEAVKRNQPTTLWLVSTDAQGGFDNTCTVASTSTSWVVSLEAPDGACANDASDDTAPRIRFKQAQGDKVLTLVAQGVEGDNATAAHAVTFDGYGRAMTTGALGQLRRIDIDYVNANNDVRPLRIEISTSGVIRMCEPRLDMTGTDPRRCLAA
jgi:type IV fimbrial biogenesis protein FimT